MLLALFQVCSSGSMSIEYAYTALSVDPKTLDHSMHACIYSSADLYIWAVC